MRAKVITFLMCASAAAVLTAAQPVAAQPPTPASGAPPATAQGARPPAAPVASPAPQANQPPQLPETYVYNAEGRRDPFVNLLGTGAEPRAASAKRGEGAAGMMVSEISVRGVMESRGSLVAMVQGPDNKTYIVHQGDKFLDGRIKTITPQGLIIIQEVNDPLSLVKQREIRKLLRSLEDAKG
jgi:Tfp pilus assembly protein PilP